MSDHRERNREGLARLRRLSSLTDAELATMTGGGWTVATVIGHMAFFDRMLLLRWDTYEKEREFAQLTPAHFDLINFAGATDWSDVPSREAATRCIDTAERAVERIDSLPDEAVNAVLETCRVALVERLLHWGPHLEQIETALGREI